MASDERSRRRRRRLLTALLAPLAGLLACELVLRWLIFSPDPLASALGARFRDAGLYVGFASSEEYQRLRARIGPFPPANTSLPHAELGWVNRQIDPLTLRHADEERVAGRRPVLLFGSSFTSCWHARAACYQGMLDASPLGQELALLNFGVSGYGPDQTLLLATRVVERFAAQDPIVIFSLVDDTDLSRATMDVFQTPKPRFVPRGEGWELRVPETLELAEYARRHPVRIASYLHRYLTYGARVLPARGEARARRLHWEERVRVSLHCLEQFVTHMRAAGLAHFVLLFHSPATFGAERPAVAAEQRRFLRALTDDGVPVIDSRDEVAAALAAGSTLEELFQAEHPGERGTAVLFGALLRGLAPLVEPAR